MRNTISDARYALRGFAKTPLFTIAALAVIALGIGLNTAAFSLFDAIVLHPLPAVHRTSELVDIDGHGFAYPSFTDMRDGTGSVFSGVAAWSSRWLSLSAADSAERVQGAVVSANYFSVLETPPAAGRFFLPAEENSGETVAVLSHALWQRHFAGSPAAIGGAVVLNGKPFHVIGVTAPSFRGVAFGSPTEVWIPVGAWPRVATGGAARLDYSRRTWSWLSVFARLSPGVDIARARSAVSVVSRRENARFPKVERTEDPRLQPLTRSAAGAGEDMDPIRFFGLLLAAVGVVLVVACANLANLLVARAEGRRREIAIRQALGAGRGRLVRQLLTESVLLAGAGGALGLLVATWSLAILVRFSLPGGGSFAGFGAALDTRVLLFATAVSLATGLLFGIAPALSASRGAVLPALKNERDRSSGGGGGRAALVASQLALCMVLLCGAGLLVRSLRNALATDLGFETRGVALASVHLGLARYDESRALRFETDLAGRAAALPGVRSVAWAGSLPLSGDQNNETIQIEGVPPVPGQSVDVTAVGPGYFATLGIPIVAGREFAPDRDAAAGPGVVVVNESAARRFWPGASPVGHRVRIYGADRTVVGVSRDSRFQSLREGAVPMVALHLEQLGGNGVLSAMTLLVRSTGDPRVMLPLLKSEAARIDPGLPVFGLRTLEESVADMLLPQRLGSGLLGLFAGMSFVLAQIGVYAVVAGRVTRRVRELGIRLALGAHPRQVRWMILRETSGSIAAGLAVGLPLAVLGTRFLMRFLYGVRPGDPVTLAAAVLVIAAGGLVAADLPARRAGRVDPIEALRSE